MTILRGLLAIVTGLMVGAFCAFLVMADGDALEASYLRLIPFVVAAGVVLGAPGWGMACLIVLPVVTHRTRIHGSLAPLPYFASAAAVGAIAALPCVFIFAAVDPGILKVLFTGGIAGGLAIALMWRLLILNPIAARRDLPNGASLG